VQWCSNLAGWFPFLRPESPNVLAFAKEVAISLGPNDGEIPEPLVEQGSALLGEDETRGLVDRFAAGHADQWRAVCADSGDTRPLERSLAAGAVRAAICDRRLPPPRRLADLESGRAPAYRPREVLVVTLFAETVWSIVDAIEAERAAAAAGPDSSLRAVLSVAADRRSVEEPRRVQALCGHLRPQLPARDHPRASRLLADAYERAGTDEAFAAEVADGLLTVYVTVRAHSYITSMN
jgi:hypothetical protein